MHGDGGHAEVIGHCLLGLWRGPGPFLLDDGQAGRDGRLTLVSRVLAISRSKRALVCSLNMICSVTYRSISPNTMSIVPMMATASAIMWPRHFVEAARCGKPGARIFRR